MTKVRKQREEEGVVVETMTLENPKQLLKFYYSGARIPSPNGGFLIPLGVRAADDGSAVLFLECSVSSLRYQLAIPKATRTDRRKVKEMQKAGVDPHCPRHGPGQRLVRAEKNLVCPLCGIAYGKG
ncbi:MAG: hypothetical protein ACE5GJ_08815 [Gemmatimonadota bacterium]